MDRGSLSKAAGHFESAIAKQPNNAEARFGFGYVSEKQGNRDRALNQYCKALSLAGGNVSVSREVEGRLRELKHTCP